ncbi:2-succinyl-5-enolpyruvyl-6-hydroxy-3-cyclohexene-1-carboxylic-acid synthase [Peribacillus sp. SCS-155]|uniref:2-succinyl-5-enolpyruvyl-6-hydroxy-3- cyclohexene-1-carboxylic-acid synthase n=1 Tax=Peribacillus sedimenti TaxID=3115297 RepID=UPI003905BAE9
MTDREATTGYISSFVDELARQDIRHVVVSPGSRSTPIALLLSEHPDINVHINVDERSAAFFALGMAKALRSPVAILCTSGTATANYLPAIVEAFYSRVPLIVLTADRPHELRDVGAPQAIDQISLYGKHTKWFVEMALPENTNDMLRYARTVCARAVATSKKEPAGPVHLNFPLREPLVPNMEEARNYRNIPNERKSTTAIELGMMSIDEEQLSEIADEINESKKGIIVCGDLRNEDARKAIVSLSDKLAFPILADPLSQLRSGDNSQETIIDTYDTFLRDQQVTQTLQPDLVIRFGSMPVSKALMQYLKKQVSTTHIVVDGGAGWRDPIGIASHMVYCEEAAFCKSIEDSLKKEEAKRDWLEYWKKINDGTKEALKSIQDEDNLDEGKLFVLLNDLMPVGASLFVSNSMPIRDLDTFFFNNDKGIKIFANRGANGIDGVVSTALGVSTIQENTVLVIGDLSFFHDMNGLLAAKLQKQNITILLVNNDGGGIFSFLPQSSEQEHFETLFGTPHGLDFEHAVALYEGKYKRVASWEDFAASFKQSFNITGLKVIEIQTNREINVKKHRELWDSVSREIKTVVSKEN